MDRIERRFFDRVNAIRRDSSLSSSTTRISLPFSPSLDRNIIPGKLGVEFECVEERAEQRVFDHARAIEEFDFFREIRMDGRERRNDGWPPIGWVG